MRRNNQGKIHMSLESYLTEKELKSRKKPKSNKKQDQLCTSLEQYLGIQEAGSRKKPKVTIKCKHNDIYMPTDINPPMEDSRLGRSIVKSDSNESRISEVDFISDRFVFGVTIALIIIVVSIFALG